MENAANGEGPLPGVGDGPEEVDNAANWIECRYEVNIDNAIKKFEDRLILEVQDSDFNAYVASDVFGTGKVKWMVKLVKQCDEPRSNSADKEKVSDGISIGIYLKAASLIEIPGGIRAKFSLVYGLKDTEPTTKSPDKWCLFTHRISEWGWNDCLTMPQLKSLANRDPTGAVKLRAVILVENSHCIAYELATHAHSLRVAELACNNKKFERQRLVEIRATYSTKGAVDEASYAFCDNKFKLAAADGKEPSKHALCDAELIGKFTTDAVGAQQVHADKIGAAEPIVAQSFYVWKILLLQASPVFKAMFREDVVTAEDDAGAVKIDDFPCEVVGAFVDYISRGPTAAEEAEDGVLAKLVRMADKYNVKDLYNLGVARMLQSIQLKNVAEYYATAHLFDIADLKTACIAAIKQKWHAEAGKAEFWSRDFGRFGVKIMAEAFADYAKLV